MQNEDRKKTINTRFPSNTGNTGKGLLMLHPNTTKDYEIKLESITSWKSKSCDTPRNK